MKLSEFGTKGDEIVARAFSLIMRMRYNAETLKYIGTMVKAEDSKDKKAKEAFADVRVYDLFAVYLKNEPKATKELFAMLNERKIEEYNNPAVLLNDIMDAYMHDDDLMRLFGLRVQTETALPSGKATETTVEEEK